MLITAKSHPYTVKIGNKIVGFPASMSLQEVEAACQRIHGKPAPVSKSLKAGPILGAGSTSSAVASRLSQILDGVDPKTAGEKEKDEIFTNLISYRKIARSLPEEQRAVLDRKIAAYNNSLVKPKPARKSRIKDKS